MATDELTIVVRAQDLATGQIKVLTKQMQETSGQVKQMGGTMRQQAQTANKAFGDLKKTVLGVFGGQVAFAAFRRMTGAIGVAAWEESHGLCLGSLLQHWHFSPCPQGVVASLSPSSNRKGARCA